MKEGLPQPPDLIPVLSRKGSHTPSPEFARHYRRMRSLILEIFPEGSDAWKCRETVMDVPPEDPAEYVRDYFLPSSETAQRLTEEGVSGFADLERKKFVANGKTLRPFQQAEAAALPLAICPGTKESVVLDLIAPYGSGKTLLIGIANSWFRNYQYRLLQSGMAQEDVPTGVFVGLRREHLMQNAVGETASTMCPPYTLEVSHVNQYYRFLQELFPNYFEQFFSLKKTSGRICWQALFGMGSKSFAGEEEWGYADHRAAQVALNRALADLGQSALHKFNANPKSNELHVAIVGMLMGDSIYTRGPDGTPLQTPAPDRSSDTSEGYTGDAFFDVPPNSAYPVKVSHADLSPGRERRPRDSDPNNPDLFYITTGSQLLGPRARQLEHNLDFYRRTVWISIDEIMQYNAQQIQYPFKCKQDIGAKEVPIVFGLAADDALRPGWTRLPIVRNTISLGISPPRGFQVAVHPSKTLPPVDSEEMWEWFLKEHMADVPLLKETKGKQPRDRNTVIALPNGRLVREYGQRFERYCEEQGIPAVVRCFDGKSNGELQQLLSVFKSPGPPRKLFANAQKLAGALSLPNLECIEIIHPGGRGNKQIAGRSDHNRTLMNGLKPKDRTFVREFCTKGMRESCVYDLAEEQGIELPEDGMLWLPGHAIADRAAYERDEKNPAVKRLQKGWKGGMSRRINLPVMEDATPLEITNQLACKKGEFIREYDFVPDREGLISEATLMEWMGRTALGPSAGSWIGPLRSTVRLAKDTAKRAGKHISNHALAVAAYEWIDRRIMKNKEAADAAAKANGNGGRHCHDVRKDS